MKKSDIVTLSVLLAAAALAVSFASCGTRENADASETGVTDISAESTEYSNTAGGSSENVDSPSDGQTDKIAASTETTAAVEGFDRGTDGASRNENAAEKTDTAEHGDAADMAGALFIGDSRTVGIMEYAGLDEADFFCSVGMSVFDVMKNRVSVPGVGKVTLTELLSNKKYDKIYIMLGINELGYNTQKILDRYEKLIEFIDSCQGAAVFVQANLHVTEKRSSDGGYINNSAIDSLNAALSELAVRCGAFYIDVNPLFDDASHSLASDKTSDNAHLYAKYYAEWGDWIREETAKYIKEG